MANSIQPIALEKLIAHPDNPNRMSRANFSRLLRNIERAGRYEPLIVRPSRDKGGCFQIINGHHRRQALSKLGCKTADCLVWDIDDEQTDILLATLNRLGGSDHLGSKIALLKRLNKKYTGKELAKLLPQSPAQIERLTNLKMPAAPSNINANQFLRPLVFFVNDQQQNLVEKALQSAKQQDQKTKAAQSAAALTTIAEYFLKNSTNNFRSINNG